MSDKSTMRAVFEARQREMRNLLAGDSGSLFERNADEYVREPVEFAWIEFEWIWNAALKNAGSESRHADEGISAGSVVADLGAYRARVRAATAEQATCQPPSGWSVEKSGPDETIRVTSPGGAVIGIVGLHANAREKLLHEFLSALLSTPAGDPAQP